MVGILRRAARMGAAAADLHCRKIRLAGRELLLYSPNLGINFHTQTCQYMYASQANVLVVPNRLVLGQ